MPSESPGAVGTASGRTFFRMSPQRSGFNFPAQAQAFLLDAPDTLGETGPTHVPPLEGGPAMAHVGTATLLPRCRPLC